MYKQYINFSQLEIIKYICISTVAVEKEFPKIKGWKEIAKPFRIAAEKSGLTEQELCKLIAKFRAKLNNKFG